MTNEWAMKQKPPSYVIVQVTERNTMKAIASILVFVSLTTSGFPLGSVAGDGSHENNASTSYSTRIYPGCPPFLHWFCHIGG